MTIVTGTRLGRYEIRSKIGAGGMGEVYLAEDVQLRRRVALKTLPLELAANQDRMRRFVQEAQAAAALNHPNIAHIYEIGEHDGLHFIAMEFIDGVTLRARMRQSEMKLGEVLDITIQSASALTAAHAANIIHRDIKPENIMLRRDGIVKVLDFGLAKLSEPPAIAGGFIDTQAATRPLVHTEPGRVMGTVAYMSPEQVRGLELDTRTDVWSLGVVLYEMLAGQAPFAGETSSHIGVSILEKEPAPLVRHAPQSPAELQRIVRKTLAKARDDRYQTARDLLIDLKNLRRELDLQSEIERSLAPGVDTPPSTTQAAPETKTDSLSHATGIAERPTSSAQYVVTGIKRHKLTAVVALLIVVAAAAGLSWYFHPRNTAVAIESLAVMPFVNASGNAEVEYLSDGMTDMLITSLSQLPKLSVKARSSVFRYKNKEASPQQVGKELNVQAILTGRLVQRGNDLTLHIELVDVNTETALWSGDYNRSMTNLVSLQGEIARDVSSKLRLKLSSPDEQKLAKAYTENTEAYQLYLKGRYHLLKLTPPEMQTGISYFQQAIDIDPKYALAYAGLADAYRAFALAAEMPPREFMPKAKSAALKAVEIDDTLAEAHAGLGNIIFWYDWNWNAAENQYKRALELNQNSADTHWGYAHFLSNTGRHAEALTEIRRAKELDPLNLRINASEGQFLLHAGRIDEGLARLQKTFELEPNFWVAHLFAASGYIEKGMYSEAVAEATKARDLSGGNFEAIGLIGYASAKSGKRDEARAVLDELKKRSTERYVLPYAFALVYNGLGERDETLAWLEKGYEQRLPKMVFLKVDPKWNNLRADPRFQDLLRRVGFPQ